MQPWSGPPKPAFVLPDLTGAQRALAELRGRPVLVHFFATWCAPCLPEMQALQRLAQRRGADALVIIAVSVAEPDLRVRRFFADLPVSFPVLLDRDRAVSKAWDVFALPTTYLLDADLNPRLVAEHDVAWDDVEIDAMLDRLPAPQGGVRTGDKQPVEREDDT